MTSSKCSPSETNQTHKALCVSVSSRRYFLTTPRSRFWTRSPKANKLKQSFVQNSLRGLGSSPFARHY